MPGYVMHLLCAKKMIDTLGIEDADWKQKFYLGNILPDVCTEKKHTHFWDDETYPLFARKPNLLIFEQQYAKRMEQPLVLGYYAHLLLDCRFIEQYWQKHFRFYNREGQEEVRFDKVAKIWVTEQNRMYDRDAFLSKRYYYGDYDRLNSYIIHAYHLRDIHLEGNMHDVSMIREIKREDVDVKLPQMIAIFESSKEKMDNELPKLSIFDYQDLELLIENVKKEMVERLKT